MEQIDRLEAGQSTDLNPLPFEPLRTLLKRRPLVLSGARLATRLASQTRVLAPLARSANGVLFREFERGYDAVVGYLLAHEEVRASRASTLAV